MSSKAFIAIAIVALVSVSLVCLVDPDDSSATIGDSFSDGTFYYQVINEAPFRVMIMGCVTSVPVHLEIPYTVDHNTNTYSVTRIGNEAFKSAVAMTSVNLRNVTVIGSNAFEGCINLATVDGTQVTSIEDSAFSGCSKLTTFQGGNLDTIYLSAFEGCVKLESIDLSDVTMVGVAAFKGCEKLESVDISSAVNIGSYAFYGSGLKSLTIPAVTNSIGECAFNNCASLPTTAITCQGTKYKIDKGALVEDNTTLKTLFEAYAPTNGHYIIDSNITTIADGAFNGCDKLVTVRIPATLTTIGCGIFRNCDKLTLVEVAGGTNFRVDNNVLYSYDRTAVYYVPPSFSGEYVAPSALTTVKTYSFLDCTAITVVKIPNVTNIENFGFSNCYNVEGIYLRSDVSIGIKGLDLGAEGHETSCKVYSDAVNFIASSKKNTYTTFTYYLSISFEGVDTPAGVTLPETAYAEKNTSFNIAPYEAALLRYGFITKLDGVITEETIFPVGTSPHTVTFQFDGKVYYTLTFDSSGGIPADEKIVMYAGEQIAITPDQPTKEGYEFVSWSQTIPATMPANDLTIYAVWERLVGTGDVVTEGSTKKVTVNENEAEISRDAINLMLTGSDNVQMTVNGDSIKMPSASFTSLAGTGDFKVRLDKSTGITNASVLERLSESKKAIAQMASVVDVTFTTNGSTSDLNGVIIIIPYTVSPGQSADKITAYYVSDSGELEELKSSYSNGALSVESTHFSTFAVCSESLSDEPSSGGINIILIAGIAVGALVLIGVVVFIIKKH